MNFDIFYDEQNKCMRYWRAVPILLVIFLVYAFTSKSYTISCFYNTCTVKERTGIYGSYLEINRFNRKDINTVDVKEKLRNRYKNRGQYVESSAEITFTDGTNYELPFIFYATEIPKLQELIREVQSKNKYEYKQEPHLFSWLARH